MSARDGRSGRYRGRRSATMPRMRVRKGDTVRVMTGPDKGAQGEVVAVYPKQGRVTVEGVNVRRKHQRPTQQNQEGQIIDYLLPIDASNVAVVCPSSGQPGKVGFRIDGDRKVRYHKASGEELQ